jgi:hypothetical protein
MAKTVIIAANVSYGGIDFNTRLLVEYEHTGKQWYKKPTHYTSSESIAAEWRAKGIKVKERPGYYFMKRLAIPNDNCGWWYINNPGSTYSVNKISKYGRRIHAELSQDQPPLN